MVVDFALVGFGDIPIITPIEGGAQTLLGDATFALAVFQPIEPATSAGGAVSDQVDTILPRQQVEFVKTVLVE